MHVEPGTPDIFIINIKRYLIECNMHCFFNPIIFCRNYSMRESQLFAQIVCKLNESNMCVY